MIRLTLCCNTGIYARCINTCGTSFVRLYLVWITNNHVIYEIMNYWSGRHLEMQIRSYLLTKDISWVHHSPAVRKRFNIQLFYSLEVHTGAMVLLPAGICTFYIFLNVKPTYKIKDKTPKLTLMELSHCISVIFKHHVSCSTIFLFLWFIQYTIMLYYMLLLLHFCFTSLPW